MKSFFNELRHRRVYRVALGYAVAAWLCIQVGATVLPAFHAPEIVLPILIVLLAIGFPIALVLGWAFDVTPSGIERTPGDGAAGTGRNKKRVWMVGSIGLAVAILFLGSYWVWRSRPAPGPIQTTSEPFSARIASTADNSIAVLPFVDLSQAKDQEYLCDGMSEELLDALSKIGALHVVARTSSFFFKGKNEDVGEIAHKLNVGKVLEGSIRREGNRIRVTAQLINAVDGFHVWSETYQRELGGAFALEDEITHAIVEALKIKLAVVTPPRAEPNVEAHDLYLQGLYFSNKSSEADLRRGLELFDRATVKDPAFARAWTGKAKSWLWLADAFVKPLEAYPQVKSFALKAIQLDDREAEAHCYLGEAIRALEWNYSAEERELERALDLDPNSAICHLFLGMLLASRGEHDRVWTELATAEKLDPLSPMISNFHGSLLLSAGRAEEALAKGLRTKEIDPTYVYFESSLAQAYREQGKFAESIAEYKREETMSGETPPGLAITYARMGRTDEARQILQQLEAAARTRYVEADLIAAIYVALGDNDRAFQWL